MFKRIALIVHNDNYCDPGLSRLKLPPADTPALATLLRNPTIGNFDRVERLFNQSSVEIRRQVANLFHRKQRDDELLLYFIGYGLWDEIGQLYLAGVDTALDMVADTAVSATYLTDCMDRSFSRRQMLLLDCCYCLVSPNGGQASTGFGADPAAAFKGRGYGRVVLAATPPVKNILPNEITDEAVAFGFTPCLIHGLQTGAADADQDGQVELRELFEYIHGQGGPVINWFHLRRHSYEVSAKLVIARNPQRFMPPQLIKWDLIFGAIMAPLTIVIIGGGADLRASIGIAGLFLLLYMLLYLAPD